VVKLGSGFFDRIWFKIKGYHRCRRIVISKENIFKKFYHFNNSKVLVVHVPAWFESFSKQNLLIWNLKKKNVSFLGYQFPGGLLSDDPFLVRDNLLFISSVILSDLRELKEKYGFEKIIFMGVSLGGVIASLVCENNNDIDELVFVVPGYSFATSLWKGILTKKLKKKFKENGISLAQLKNIWSKIEPYKHCNNFKAKKIFVYASKSDIIIPFEEAKKITDLFQKKYSVETKFNDFLGHALTILRVYFKPDFL